jgi:hypothetical protein
MNRLCISIVSLLFLFFFRFQTFSQALNFALPPLQNQFGASLVSAATHLRSADFNGDGFADIVVACAGCTTNAVSVILNTGSGGGAVMGTPTLLSLPLGALTGLEIGDVDGDGDIDIMAFGFSGGSIRMQIYLNNGSGGFIAGTNPSIGTPFTSAVHQPLALDYDMDGDIDFFVLANISSQATLVRFTNDGTGGFLADGYIIGSPALQFNANHRLVAAVVVNSTLKPEILLHINNGNSPQQERIYRITNLGSLVSPITPTIAFAHSGAVRDIGVGDFDLDGDTDIIFLDSASVRILTGNGAGVFNYSYYNVPPNSPNRVFVADLDYDNDLDFVLAEPTVANDNLRIYRNTGTGTFPIPNIGFVSPVGMDNVGFVAFGDFDNDGKMDMVETDNGDDSRVLLNTTSGLIPEIDASLRNSFDDLHASGPGVPKKDNFTVEGWFYTNALSPTDNQTIFHSGTDINEGFGLYIKANDDQLFVQGDIGTSFTTGAKIVAGRWYHFALVKNETATGNWQFYLNGRQTITGSITNAVGSIGGQTRLGNINATEQLNGNLAEIRFWNVALKREVIVAWMHRQVNRSHPKYFALHSYFPLVEASTTAQNTQDLAYTINPIALERKAEDTLSSYLDFDTGSYPPLGDNGSSESRSITGTISWNARPKVGITTNFSTELGNPAPDFPDGEVSISRVFDEVVNFPTLPLVYSKVYWVFHNFGNNTTFDNLEQIDIDIKDDQFLSGLYPILNTPSDPNPLAANFKLFMRPIGSISNTDWVQVGQGDGFGSVKARRPGSSINEFGRVMVVGVDATALPVRLIRFTGKKIDANTNLLEWQTAFEYNNEVFEVEKSYDAKNFFVIGKIEGNEKSEKPKTYHFEDKYGMEPAYYRISQKDKDGKRNYTKHIYIAAEDEKMQDFVIFPNPVSDKVQLRFPAIETEEFRLEIFNDLGIKVFDFTGNKLFLEESLQQNLVKMPAGFWIAKLSNGFKTYTTKWIKNR